MSEPSESYKRFVVMTVAAVILVSVVCMTTVIAVCAVQPDTVEPEPCLESFVPKAASKQCDHPHHIVGLVDRGTMCTCPRSRMVDTSLELVAPPVER